MSLLQATHYWQCASTAPQVTRRKWSALGMASPQSGPRSSRLCRGALKLLLLPGQESSLWFSSVLCQLPERVAQPGHPSAAFGVQLIAMLNAMVTRYSAAVIGPSLNLARFYSLSSLGLNLSWGKWEHLSEARWNDFGLVRRVKTLAIDSHLLYSSAFPGLLV